MVIGETSEAGYFSFKQSKNYIFRILEKSGVFLPRQKMDYENSKKNSPRETEELMLRRILYFIFLQCRNESEKTEGKARMENKITPKMI